MNEDAYKRAFKILSLFFESKDLPEELHDRVTSWLVDKNNREEKDAALWRIFCKTLSGEDPGVIDIDEYDTKEREDTVPIC